ncbi:hypothetical protein, partial [Peptoniphilus harei]|uniref:hypothetical protein n=1 Tax=Peptoniphilus harei TaxID=54005 RepID=UPI00290F222C
LMNLLKTMKKLNSQEESKKSNYLSIEDFSKRTKAGNSVITILQKNGILKDLDETNQISLFNF